MELAGTIVLPTGQAYEVLTADGRGIDQTEWERFVDGIKAGKAIALVGGKVRLRPVLQFLRTDAEKAEQDAVLKAVLKPAAAKEGG